MQAISRASSARRSPFLLRCGSPAGKPVDVFHCRYAVHIVSVDKSSQRQLTAPLASCFQGRMCRSRLRALAVSADALGGRS